MKQRKKQSGNAVIETAFMLPWLVFLFVGVLDFGFYSYAAICTQNAARAAAMVAASNRAFATSPASFQDAACRAARQELAGVPNMIGVTTCGSVEANLTDAVPITSCLVLLTNAAASTCGSTFVCADCDLKATATSALAVVSYRTLPMIPIPGALMGRLTLTRIAEARVAQ